MLFFAACIVGLFCGIICINIAESKGYAKSTFGVWFIIGLLFSFIGVIIALVVQRKTEGYLEQGLMKICPFCKEAILRRIRLSL